jgi:hypothetical protein
MAYTAAQTELLDALIRAFIGAYQGASFPGAERAVGNRERAFERGIEYVERRLRRLSEQLKGDSIARVAEIRRMAEEGKYLDVAELQAALFKEFGRDRALVIARTEEALASNVGFIDRAEDDGYELVKIIDGTSDEWCKFANGAIWTLETWRNHPIAHPNCQRTGYVIVPSEIGRYRRFVKEPHPDEPSMLEFAEAA